MRILVLSDTHGNIRNELIDSIKRNGSFDMMIHCGDNYIDAREISEETGIENYLNVRGNCDYRLLSCPETLEMEIEGKKFIITHGHLFGVKANIDSLKIYAKNNEADVVTFGHSHIPYNHIEDGILFINPGSPTFPVKGDRTFAVIEITDGKINSQIINM